VQKELERDDDRGKALMFFMIEFAKKSLVELFESVA
jgi:hypothetical protein